MVGVRFFFDVICVGFFVIELYVWDNKNLVVIFGVCFFRDVFVVFFYLGIVEWGFLLIKNIFIVLLYSFVICL